MVGKPFKKIIGSWPYTVDFSTKCTSVVDSVLSAILVDIIADGTLDTLWEQHLSLISDIDCSESPYYSASSNSATQFEIEDLAGVIYIYISFAGLALLFHIKKICQHYYATRFNNENLGRDSDTKILDIKPNDDPIVDLTAEYRGEDAVSSD